MNAPGSIKLVCFELCGETFAFNMDYLVEIVQIQPAEITPFFTPIPLIRGQWWYRHRLIDVLDIRDFFGLKEQRSVLSDLTAPEEHAKDVIQPANDQEPRVAPPKTLTRHPSKTMLVVKIRGQAFGLLTDAVLQVKPLEAFYEYPTMLSTLSRRYFAGVTIINGALVLVLAIDEFINEYELTTLLSGKSEPPDAPH